MEVKEAGERCSCGGEIDRLYELETNVYRGRCFICGKRYTVLYVSTKQQEEARTWNLES
jgi:hypothetical protein